jgi:phage terminase large subunit-like protein
MVAQAVSPELRLFPRQMRFVRSQAKYPAYIGGIGSGKSFAGGAKVISRLDRQEIGLIAAPTYQMLRDSTLEGFFRLLDGLGIPYEHVKSENTITFATGHKILCRSLEDPDTARGPNLDYAWIDEAGYVAAKGWQIVKGRVRVGTNPQAWITSTPKGRNWIWEEWERDATGTEFDPSHPLYRVHTDENPELPENFSASLGYSGTFAAQELGGEFVAFEGLVYPGFRRDVHVVRTVDTAGWATALGMDVGSRNPTGLIVCKYAGDRRHYASEHYERGMSSDSITDLAVRAWEAHRPEFMVIDPSAAGLILSLAARGIRVRKANNDVTVGIANLTSLVEGRMPDGTPRLTVDPSCVNLIAEFESYRYRDGGRGNADAPVKENDHLMDAARYLELELSAPPKRWGIA